MDRGAGGNVVGVEGLIVGTESVHKYKKRKVVHRKGIEKQCKI